MASDFATLILNTGVARGENLMRFVTGIKFTAQVAKMVNNITFLYDPNWTYGAYTEATLPCSFYFVRKWEETGVSDVSTRAMMFYNSKGAEGTQRNGAVLDVVADNVINQPKEYRAEILLPFTPDAALSQYQMDADTFLGVTAFAGSGSSPNETLAVTSRVVSNSISLLKTLFSVFSVNLSASSIANLILSQNDINKVSLDAMRDGRGIVKMKMWNGWKFIYVMIKSVNLTKSGEYEGYYEGNITVQEVPVINVYQQDEISGVERQGSSLLEKVVGAKVRSAFDALTGVTGT